MTAVGPPVHERFGAWARRSPEATALVLGKERMTYGELDRRTDVLAGRLQAAGIGSGALVGVAVPRTFEPVVSILGAWKAGAAYLPLDPGYPGDRLDFMAADSGIDTILTPSEAADRMARPGVRLIRTDGEADEPGRTTGTRRHPLPADLAYVMYTSGSTGTPKGVMVTHGNVARLFDATEAWFGFGPSDVWTLFHSGAFDFSVWELWGALTHGGSVVVVPHDVARAPNRFRQLVADEGVTVLNQTPSAFHGFVDADRADRTEGRLALREVIFGGEALDFASLAPWLARHGDVTPRLVNMYGITETTVHVTYRPLSAADAHRGGPSLIGVPLPDLELHVLAPDGTPATVGEVGELHVGGAGVAAGYLDRPELTRERFVRGPAGASAQLYRTGDLVRATLEGELEYHGRRDDQVQLRGFRVELGEVRAVVAAHPGVRSAAIALDGQGTPEQRLVAYLVPAPEGVSEEELRVFAAARLPEHMVPSVWIVLDRLPLTANGKLDRDALPGPGRQRPDLAASYRAPSDDLERYLARVWAEVLGLDRVGIDDPFFDLGGTSLQAAQLVARLEEDLAEPIFDVTVFTAPSVASYARLLRADHPEAVAARFADVGAVERPSSLVAGATRRDRLVAQRARRGSRR